jgi:SAM-dependent methyltransferase
MEGGAYAEMYQLEDRHWWFRGRRKLIWALLRYANLQQQPRILDAGCGTGRNLVEFGSLGAAEGFDPSQDAVEFCHLRGLANVRQANLESLPFPPDTFDLLFACDVVEHIEDDHRALSELFRVAAPGASLVLTVPAYQWMWTAHDAQLHHYRRYTLGVLRERASAAGWQPVRHSYFNSFLLPVIVLARALARFLPRQGHTDLDRTPEVLNGVLEMPMALEAALVARGVTFPAGVSLGMLLRKPA